jgi:hypothetical protein
MIGKEIREETQAKNDASELADKNIVKWKFNPNPNCFVQSASSNPTC